MTKTKIRPALLRQYHEATYGDLPLNAKALAGVSFDEYVALRRIRYPKMSAWQAAVEAPTAELRAQAKKLERPQRQLPAMPVFATIARQPTGDLLEALGSVEPNVQRLLLDRIKTVTGWAAIASLDELDDLELVLCDTTDSQAVDPPLRLRRVALTECSTAAMGVALRSTRARVIDIAYPQTTVFDAGMLASHCDVEEVTVTAPLVHRLAGLAELPLRVLRLGRVEPNGELGPLLRAVASTLEELTITGTRPFGPEQLPKLPALARLDVPGTPETRDAWIDYAVKHPQVACRFAPFEAPPPKALAVTVLEIHRGVDILQATKGKKTFYEVAFDVAAALDGYDGDNGDLEAELKGLAKRGKKRGLKWSSEADTLVVQATKPDTLRWVLDAAFGLAS